MNRRHFLGAIIASACAPAIVRASSLMPVRAHTRLVPGYRELTVAELHDILKRCDAGPYVLSGKEFMAAYMEQHRQWLIAHE